MSKSKDARRFMTVSEFAATMRTTAGVVRGWIKKGSLRAQYIIPEHEVKRWTENEDSRRVATMLEVENRFIEIVRFEPAPQPLNPIQDTPDIDFLLGGMKGKVDYLESENRRLMDQNLRLRSVLRDELLLWQSILYNGRQLRFIEAKRQISRLVGATSYDGRDEAPMDYKEREIGGNLRQAQERLEARRRGWEGPATATPVTEEPADRAVLVDNSENRKQS
jgi:hypothetical protein